MNTNELKVGDKVKFYNYSGTADGNIAEGIIEENVIPYNWKIRTSLYLESVNPSHIISKLEPLPIQYKEIKIEHNEWQSESCFRCGEPGKYKKNEYYFQAYCDKCRAENENKEKSAPKSYKFHINITSMNVDQERYGSKPNVTVGGFGQSLNNNYFEFTGLDFPNDFDPTKTYTMEIKEKV